MMSHETLKPVVVREFRPEDEAEWLLLRKELWPDSDGADASAWIVRSDAATLVAEVRPRKGIAGFVEVGVRAYADGCESSPVAFLEGWYVAADHRKKGLGKELVQAAMVWAKARGLRQLASDSLLEDTTAYLAHLGVGFEEVERSIKYRLALE